MNLDIARWAAALERPGIDPRTWTTLAVVTAVDVSANGVHCAITTIAGVDETAALSPEYAGPGFGLYAPISVGDGVVVVFPEGVMNTGGRIIGRVWDEGDPPPGEVTAHPQDFILVVQENRSLRLVAHGTGDVRIGVDSAGKVRLGSVDATDPVALKSDLDAFVGGLDARLEVIAAQITALTPGLPGTLSAIQALQADAHIIQVIKDALPVGWPFCAQRVTAV